MRLVTVALIVVVFTGFAAHAVWGFGNPWGSAWRTTYDTACQELLDATQSGQDCALCHNAGFALNPYAEDALAAAESASSEAEALLAIELLDSDGDGVDNITEIGDCTNPGDPSDVVPNVPMTWGKVKALYR